MLFRLMEVFILLLSTFMLWREKEQSLFTRWMSACLILIGLQRITSIFQVYTLPYLQATSYPTILIEELQLFVFIVYSMFVVLLPYIVLMGWFVFSDSITRAIGAVLMLFFFQTIPSLYHNFNWFWLYAGGCLLIGILLIGVMLSQENMVNRKRIVIAGAASLLLNLVIFYFYTKEPNRGFEQPLFEGDALKIHGPDEYFNSIAFLMIFIFSYFALKYGKFGIKLHIEKQRLDSSIMAIKSGTAILTHTIKNEMEKLNYLRGRIEDRLRTNNIEHIEEHLARMGQVTDHLQGMIDRIQDKTGDIHLVKSKMPLHGILGEVTNQLEVYLEKYQLQKVEELDSDVMVKCDPIHLQEALFNLCMNAIEAMEPDRGILTIRMMLSKRNVTIEIRDNGKGIPKDQFAKVFEPFFTTKKHTHHFGLGLSYCHSVIRAHAGTLRIVHSEINKGTTFAIVFPRNSFVEEAEG